MGLVRLRIKEFADKKGWTYARLPERATVDLTALCKLARTFDVMMEDLFEIVKE